MNKMIINMDRVNLTNSMYQAIIVILYSVSYYYMMKMNNLNE
jgi:hypothetical protein